MESTIKPQRYWITLLEHKHLQHLIDSKPIIDDGSKKIFQSTKSSFPHGIRVNDIEYHALELLDKPEGIVAYVYDLEHSKRVVRLGFVSLNDA